MYFICDEKSTQHECAADLCGGCMHEGKCSIRQKLGSVQLMILRRWDRRDKCVCVCVCVPVEPSL